MCLQGTAVGVNSYNIHYNPQFLEDPHSFNPERFLDSDGKFQAKKGRDFAFGSGETLSKYYFNILY